MTAPTAADLYIVLFDTVRSKPDSASHGTEGYYFAANGQYSALEVARTISEVLVDIGVGESREPAAFTQEEADKFFGVCRFSEVSSPSAANSQILFIPVPFLQKFWPLFGTNSYARADRSRALGWKPTRSIRSRSST